MNFEQKQSVGKELRKLRAAKNWTQEHLAGASDVPLRTVQRAEKGDGIGPENLFRLADAFGLDVQTLLQTAEAGRDTSPELRLTLRQVTQGEDLIRLLQKRGNLHIGPPGEHEFNGCLGESLIALQEKIEDCDGTHKGKQKLTKDAAYLLTFAKQSGFPVFAKHYNEEFKHQNKTLRKPTTIIIAAHQQDQRIKETTKGLVLDYVVDSRRQLLSRLQNDSSTIYDWMQDQLIAKSDGPERVEETLRAMNDRIRKEMRL